MSDLGNTILNFADKYLGEYKLRNGELTPQFCPFCKGGSNNDAFTMSISMYNGLWNCKRGSCNRSGSFKDLANEFGYRFDDSFNSQSFNVKRKKAYRQINDLELYPMTEDIKKYFALRHISENTLEKYKISADKNGNIIFPFFRDGVLTYVKYRKPYKYTGKSEQVYENGVPLIKDGKPVMRKPPKEWQESNTESILFGMDMCNFDKPLVITEGEIDAMSLTEAGIENAVSVPCGCSNLDWVESCYDWLEQFNQIILFGDSDEPGLNMINILQKRLGEERCQIPDKYPELVIDGKDCNRICKDANEILFAYGPKVLAEIVRECKSVPIKGVLNLADIPFVDPTTIPRIFTRIPELDNMIGGLSEGGVTVVSGKRGEGKSTINGSFMLNALQQNFNVCAYSGELSAYKFLEWTMLQATESKFIDTRVDIRSGKVYPVVNLTIQERIKEWIDGRFFLFDNSIINDCSQQDAILKVFEVCAKKYGCKLFLVDNLMIALTSADEENKAQAKFAAALKAFAVKYKVHVILVAHPRKTKAGETFNNDDVSGSSAK